MLFKNPVSVRRLSIISLIVCYLSLLGFHYANQSIDEEVQEILASEEFRRELPRELSELASPKRAPLAPKELAKAKRYQFKKGELPTHAPNQLQGEARYRYYEDLASRYGLQVRGTTVVGLRGLAPSGIRHDSADNATMYDDTFIVLNPKQKSVTELLGSTHAGQFVSTLSPNGVAQIKPGIYRAYPCGEYADMPCWLVTTSSGRESVPCWRDADGSGYIEADEKRGRLEATEILFHNGRYEDYGSSIGCQVLPPRLMERFIQEVGVDSSFDYLLVDANRKFE